MESRRRSLRIVDPKLHWDKVYQSKQPTEVSWYRPHLEISLKLIERAASRRDAAIIDVGAGESTLVDDLLARGFRNLHAMDLSSTALDVAKARLGTDANKIRWLCGDVRTYPFGRQEYDVWHDRAVFHFLTDADDRRAYVQQVVRAVKSGGHVIVATFGPEGPTQCSGLDVVRYDSEALHHEFGNAFRLVEHRTELHQTPSGSTQQFTYCYCKIAAAAD
jgi:2-polyprenyl-3-methyl-5-hydroxy-6-metoxy-1,4-benzoquinol methylase